MLPDVGIYLLDDNIGKHASNKKSHVHAPITYQRPTVLRNFVSKRNTYGDMNKCKSAFICFLFDSINRTEEGTVDCN